jgi:hypothetical protein
VKKVPTAIFLFIAIAGAGAWLFWQRTGKVDMAAYVPAQAMAFAEIDDLPRVAAALGTISSWDELWGELRLTTSPTATFLRKVAGATGVGPSDLVLFDRAQIGVAIFGFDANDVDQTLKVKPKIALVVETHSSPFRSRSTLRRLISNFVKSGNQEVPSAEYESEGAQWTQWNLEPDKRRIFLVINASQAVISNDEASARACLAAVRGEAPTLASVPEYKTMKARVNNSVALAFGYVASKGTDQLLQLVARAYAVGLAEQPAAQSAAASLLPTISNRLSGELGWSVAVNNGRLKDDYLFEFHENQSKAADPGLQPGSLMIEPALSYIPQHATTFTAYRPSDPSEAWQSFRSIISSRLDVTSSFFINRLLDVILEPYGIADPVKFLKSVDSPVVTARMGDNEDDSVVVARLKDQITLKQSMGSSSSRAKAHAQRNSTISGRDNDAFEFKVAGNLVIIGKSGIVQQCIDSNLHNRTIVNAPRFDALRQFWTNNSSIAVTISSEAPTGREIWPAVHPSLPVPAYFASDELGTATTTGLYRVTSTTVNRNGFERTTFSNFGLFGDILRAALGR